MSRIVIVQCPARCFTQGNGFLCRPLLLIDRQQQIEAVKEEMSRAASGIENAKVARVLPRAVLYGVICGAYEVFANCVEARFIAEHLQPEPAQRVVREELHNITRCEE